SGLNCFSQKYISTSYQDNIKNGDKTKMDCGDSYLSCNTGGACARPQNCLSGVCSNRTCAAPSCSDGIRNGGESDIDCGGPCAPCPIGRACAAHADCAPWLCAAGRCGLGS